MFGFGIKRFYPKTKEILLGTTLLTMSAYAAYKGSTKRPFTIMKSSKPQQY